MLQSLVDLWKNDDMKINEMEKEFEVQAKKAIV